MGVAVRGDDLRAQLDPHVRLPIKLLDQVARHALLQGFTSYDQRHGARMIGKVQSGLASRVPGTDQVNVESVSGARFAARRSVVDPLPDEPIEAIVCEAPPRYTGSKDDC